jgi:predicted nucleic acid-binding protein
VEGRHIFKPIINSFLSEIHLNAASVRAQAKSRTQEQLLTMDVLVLATMKNAAKCDT